MMVHSPASELVRPQTLYARSGDVHVAYQIVGEGPFDLVFVPGFVSNLEYGWEEPTLEQFYGRLASFCRLVIFDRRGTGQSDRVSGVADLETRMDDVRAIMDALGSRRAAVLGYSDGAAMAALFAATYPERTAALVLYGAYLCWEWISSERKPLAGRERELLLEESERRWGQPDRCEELLQSDAPSMVADEHFARWYATRLRLGASPGAARALLEMNLATDVRPLLSSIRVPTLIVHRTGDRNCDLRNAHFAAEQIPDSRLVELPGDDHLPWVGDSDAVIREIEEFVTGIWEAGGWAEPEPERVVSTVLFTDIVDSTAHAARLGDRAWRELLQAHHAIVRKHLARFRGQELDTTGDGFFASFDGPARAIRCAAVLTEALRELGLEIRAGLHTGECEIVDGKVAGIAVHIGARIAHQAQAGAVLVSSTVKDLVAGSGLQFRDCGVTQLRGVPGEWHLFALVPVLNGSRRNPREPSGKEIHSA